MRTAVLALILTLGASVRADDLRLFYDGATPMTPPVQQALQAALEHDRVSQTGILLTTLGVGFIDKDNGASWPMAVVFLSARESTPSVCRGKTRHYGYDDEAKKWASLDAMPSLSDVTYFFKPAMKLKCERLLAQPTLIMGTFSDADILAIVDSVRSARIEKAFEGSVTFQRGGRIKAIGRQAIQGGEASAETATVFIADRRLGLSKHDSQWWITGADETSQ
jgi:hypothetical protein